MSKFDKYFLAKSAQRRAGDLSHPQPVADAKCNALVELTTQLVAARGHAPGPTIDRFITAGYSKDQLLEVLIGVGLKTISNYFDHVSPPVEVDDQFQHPNGLN
jgi:alkylhydroperoxidase family enzyme